MLAPSARPPLTLALWRRPRLALAGGGAAAPRQRLSAAAGCVAFKYTPYGPVLDVAPYLIRRAQENADVLGAVGKEMRLLTTELRRRARGGA